MSKEELKIRIETIEELLNLYQSTAEFTFGKHVKRTGLIFQVGKKLKAKYESEAKDE